MHKTFCFCLLSALVTGLMMLAPQTATAAVNLPWSTTFNCPEWKQSDGSPTGCDDLSLWGSWTCDNGDGTVREEQITAAANYPGGTGGKGQRHWKGFGYDINSGGLRIAFTSPQPEIWVRWYMRYEAGFRWVNDSVVTDKWMIVYGPADRVVPEFQGADTVALQFGANQCRSATGHGWQSVNGGPVADGRWHMYEFHLKHETAAGVADGVGQLWIDGTLAVDCANQTFGGQFDSVLVGSNNLWPDVARCMAIDFDDLAIRTTGPIGPVGPADTTPPAAPSNLTVQ